jgi:hypothetical protein
MFHYSINTRVRIDSRDGTKVSLAGLHELALARSQRFAESSRHEIPVRVKI